MNRNVFLASALGAAVALGLVTNGCSSTSNSGTGGVDGSTGVGGSLSGQGGATAGQGGTTGQGGASADAGQDAATVMMCNPAPADGTQCNNNPPCSKNCGVNIMDIAGKRAQKTCTCSGTWTCGTCTYPTDFDPTCLRLPTPPVACPRDTSDGGSTLIKSGVTPCTPPNSEVCGNVCGSATDGTFSYQDSTGAGKVGYCVCISGAYQCASVAEWPTVP